MKKGSGLAVLLPLAALLVSAFIVSFLFPRRSTPAEVLVSRPSRIGPCSAETFPTADGTAARGGDSADLVRSWLGREAATRWERAAIRYFALLRDNYAGYGPSGGDARFGTAFRSLAEDLAVRRGSLDAESFARELTDSLAFLQDSHFTVRGGDFSGNPAGLTYWYTTGDDWLLEKRGAGYRFLSGPIAGADIAAEAKVGGASLMVKPTIDREGRVAWRLVASRHPGDGESPIDLCFDVTARRLGRDIRASIPFMVDDASPPSPEKSRSVTAADCGSYAKFPTFMHADDDGKAEQVAFPDSLPELRAAPVLVLDLRGNMGGHSDVIDAWISSFCGTDLPLCLGDLQTVRAGKTATDDTAWKKLAPRLDAAGMLPRVKGPNRILFVLMDQYCGSSAEDAVRELSVLDGALLVGMPTAGQPAYGDTRWYRDEETDTAIFFGDNIKSWYPQGWRNLPEGHGIEPDLWVPTAYARERAEALVARYGTDTLARILRE